MIKVAGVGPAYSCDRLVTVVPEAVGVLSYSGAVVTDDPSCHPHQTAVMRRLRLSPMFTTPAVGYWGSVM